MSKYIKAVLNYIAKAFTEMRLIVCIERDRKRVLAGKRISKQEKAKRLARLQKCVANLNSYCERYC